MKLIHLLLQNSWRTALLATLTSLLSGASTAGLIALINLTLKNTTLPIALLASGFVMTCLIMVITSAVSQIFIAHLSEDVIFDLRMMLTRRILACPLRQLEEIGAPQLLATLIEDTEAVSTASFSISLLFMNIALVFGCFLYVSWLSFPVLVFVLGFTVIATYSYQLLVNTGGKVFKFAREQQDRLFKHFHAIIAGTKELKLHRQRRQVFLSEDFLSTATAARHYRVNALTIFAIAGNWGILLMFIGLGFLLFVLTQVTTISEPVLSGCVLTILFAITPVNGILNTFPNISRANVSLQKIESLGLSLAEATEYDGIPAVALKSTWMHLQLKGVTHTYQGEQKECHFMLGPIDLSFEPGEQVLLVGGNGSGKSTLVKLISGLYTPDAGEILLDDQPITDENRECYRQKFSVVFYDFYLFERLIGLENPNLDITAQAYLRQLQLEHKVQLKEGILSTTALSQGERKRLALLTAYLENRSIYIFDEWASDQDPVFKEIFYTQLLPNLKHRGKTVIVVSHDERYFHTADRIVKLNYGKVEGV
jgi:putative pyoverdin transport system ATP-binding/permease protein